MKLLLLHGPAINSSRNKLKELRNKFPSDSVMVFEKGEDMGAILTNLQSNSLFEEERLVIVENAPEDFINYTLYPKSDSSQASLIPCTLALWFDHELSLKKSVLEWVKKARGEIFFFPEAREVSVFPFLDYLTVKDQKAFLELQKLKEAGFDIQYLITMVFYLLRNLAVTPKNAPQFVKDKLVRQRKNFDLEKITKLYRDIIEIDFKIKSGLLENSQAEFLLVNRFMN